MKDSKTNPVERQQGAMNVAASACGGAAGARRVLRSIPLSQIDFEPQVRASVTDESVAELAKSVAVHGVQQPPLLRPTGDRWTVVDGERRVKAARLAGAEFMEAVIDEGAPTESRTTAVQLTCNLHRSDLTPLELARGIARLMRDTPCTAAQAATTLALSAPTVSRLLAILELPEEVQQLVQDETLPASTAYEIAKTKDPKRKQELIAAAGAGKGALRRDEAAGLRHAVRKSGEAAKRERIRIPAGEACSIVVTGKHLRRDYLIQVLEGACQRLRGLSVDGDCEALVAALAEGNGRAVTAPRKRRVAQRSRRVRATKVAG